MSEKDVVHAGPFAGSEVRWAECGMEKMWTLCVKGSDVPIALVLALLANRGVDEAPTVERIVARHKIDYDTTRECLRGLADWLKAQDWTGWKPPERELPKDSGYRALAEAKLLLANEQLATARAIMINLVNDYYGPLGETKADAKKWLDADRLHLHRQEVDEKCPKCGSRLPRRWNTEEFRCPECQTVFLAQGNVHTDLPGWTPGRKVVRCPLCETAWPLEPDEKRCGTCLLQIMYDGNPVISGGALAADPCPWFSGSHDSNGPPWPDCRFWKTRKEQG